MQQNIKKARIVAGLMTVLTLGLHASFAQAATFSGEAVGLQANVIGVSLKPPIPELSVKRGEREHVGGECQRRGYSIGRPAEQLHVWKWH